MDVMARVLAIRTHRSLVCAALAAAVVVASSGPGSAASPDAVGWWHRGLAVTAEGTLPLPGDARSPLVPVPAGGLYVANDATGPRAIAAVRFSSARGPAVLTLRISGDALLPLGSPLLACAVTTAWEPVENGSWQVRPALDCDLAVEGTFVAEDREVRFEIADLDAYRSARGVELGITPAANDPAPFAVAFDAPGDDALAAAIAPPTSSPPTQPAFPGSAVIPPSGSGDPFVVSDLPPPSESAAATPSPAQPAEPPVAAGHVRGIPTHGAARAVITAGLGLAAAAVWLTSGGSPTLRRRHPLNLELEP